MSGTTGQSLRFSTTAVVHSVSLIIAGFAFATLFGWSTASPLLASMGQRVAMNPMTAVAFLSAGASLWLLRDRHAAARVCKLGRFLAIFVAIVGILKLLEYSLGWNVAPDRL